MIKQSKVSPSLRHYHRINVDFPTRLETAAGEEITCKIANLSRAGLMTLCTPEMIRTILPNQEPIAPHLAVPLWVNFELPEPEGEPRPIQARCDVIYVRRVSRDCFHLGMSFVDFEADDGTHVETFVTDHMGPPEPSQDEPEDS